MKLKKALFTGLIITVVSMPPLYAAECPKLSLNDHNDFIKGTLLMYAPEINKQSSLPVYFVKESFLKQNQMEMPTSMNDYPLLDANTIDTSADVALTYVTWNSETKQITCHYEIPEKIVNQREERYYGAIDLTTLRKDISDPIPLEVSSTITKSTSDDNKLIWQATRFYDDGYKYMGSECSGYGTTIPSYSCMWQ